MQITDDPEERIAIKQADGIIDAPETPTKPEQVKDNPYAARIELARQEAIKQAERVRLRRTRHYVSGKMLASGEKE